MPKAIKGKDPEPDVATEARDLSDDGAIPCSTIVCLMCEASINRWQRTARRGIAKLATLFSDAD